MGIGETVRRMLGRGRDTNGFAPRPPDGTRIYAVGDIHGRADLLARIHGAIREDAGRGEAARRVIVYVGDYVDRGLNSRGVLDTLLHAPLEGFERVHLKGNHDAWMLAFLADPGAAAGWLEAGGQATLLSYGVPVEDGAPEERIEQARAGLAQALPRAHRTFLETLAPWHVEGDYVFVHAGLRPGVSLEQQSEEDLLWTRAERNDGAALPGRVVVHGHTVTEAPAERPHRIGIDTGAFASGTLTCLILEGARRRFLHT